MNIIHGLLIIVGVVAFAAFWAGLIAVGWAVGSVWRICKGRHLD